MELIPLSTTNVAETAGVCWRYRLSSVYSNDGYELRARRATGLFWPEKETVMTCVNQSV